MHNDRVIPRQAGILSSDPPPKFAEILTTCLLSQKMTPTKFLAPQVV